MSNFLLITLDFQTLIDYFDSSDQLINAALEESFRQELDEKLPELEKSDIETQNKVFKEWQQKRDDTLNDQVHWTSYSEPLFIVYTQNQVRLTNF